MEELKICGINVIVSNVGGKIIKIDFPKDKITKGELFEIYEVLISEYTKW
jgi:hypothetical protein